MSDQHSPYPLGSVRDLVARTRVLDHLTEKGLDSNTSVLARYVCLRVWLSPPVDTAQTLGCGPIVVVCHQKSLHLSIILSTPVTTDSTCDRMHFSGSDQRHGFERRIIDDVHAKLEHIPLQLRDETAAGVKSGAGRTAYTRYNHDIIRKLHKPVINFGWRWLDFPLIVHSY